MRTRRELPAATVIAAVAIRNLHGACSLHEFTATRPPRPTMPISKRVTARFYKRARTRPTSIASASPSCVRREDSELHNLPVVETPVVEPAVEAPVMETHSNLVAQTFRTSRALSRSISFSDYLRDARTRAEKILREHPRYDGSTGPTCEPCLAAYPCDAAKAAEDVISIVSRLHHPGRFLASRALLDFMADLVDLAATDAVLGKSKADPQAPRADSDPESSRLAPH